MAVFVAYFEMTKYDSWTSGKPTKKIQDSVRVRIPVPPKFKPTALPLQPLCRENTL
jgi:hypothetical protein